MITILPMADEKRKAEILSSYPMVAAKQDVLVMAEAEEELGYVVLAVDHTNLKLLDMTVSGSSLTDLTPMAAMVADSLLRGAASYGEHFGAERILAYLPQLAPFLIGKGFQREGDCLALPMSAIVRRTKPRER